MADSESEGEDHGWHGVNPLPAQKRQRKDPPPQSHSFFYSSHAQPSSSSPYETAADDEDALMAAMGLPTRLRQGTAESSGDDYTVCVLFASA